MKDWAADLGRATGMLLASSLVAFLMNALSAHPLSVWSKDGPGTWEGTMPRITISQLKEALHLPRSVVLLDVRSEAAFAGGHPAAAWNLPFDRLTEEYTRLGLRPVLRAADLVVVLCESSNCSAADASARLLAHLGHDRVKVLHDGWRAYENSGLGVTAP